MYDQTQNDPCYRGRFDNENHFGRGERTRTFDLTVPNRARYQLRHTPLYDVTAKLRLSYCTLKC